MHLSFGQLFASLAVSSVGFVLLTYGRKQARPPQLLAGLALMIFPYFVPSLPGTLLTAAGVLAVMGVAVRLGW